MRLHDNCDALVVTAMLERGQLTTAEPMVTDFLSGKIFVNWVETALGL